VVGAIIAVVALRIAVFAATSAAARSAGAVWLIYGLPLGAIVISIAIVAGGPRLRAAAGRLGAGMRRRLAGLAPTRLRLGRA
jgi:lipopolysaccharide export system permease protein